MVRAIVHYILKTLGLALVVFLFMVCVTSVTPIYRFRAPAPFQGPDIFNPYRELDTANCWKRSLFHCHTRVKGPLNECEFWPGEVYDDLKKFNYDIITFSNHNELTVHPYDSTLQVNVYEHGYNLFKYHKLVFGCKKVIHFDHLIPLLTSQKQFQLDYLGRSSDFIQMNHPYRTVGTCKKHFEELSGYEIMELDSGSGTENEYWDWALSAGHYSFGLANDDLHYPDRTHKIAVRCNFLCSPDGTYASIKKTLLGGGYYAMRVPDYGDGDWAVKYEKNRHLPFVQDIGMRDDGTIYLKVSVAADSIKVYGQDHATLARTDRCDTLSYTIRPEDTYARMTAWFPEGEVIYTNPFARFDSSVSATPYDGTPQQVSIPLTILFNLLLLALAVGLIVLFHKILFWK